MNETKILTNGLELIDKHITTESKKFNKPDTVYLLGETEGTTVWMVRPKFDCNWYWGFGYLEMYCRKDGSYCNNPKAAYDVESHSHFDCNHFKDSNYTMPNDFIRLKSITTENVVGLNQFMRQIRHFRDDSDELYKKDEKDYIYINLIALPRLFALMEKAFSNESDSIVLWTVQDFQKQFLMRYKNTKEDFQANHVQGIFLFNKRVWNEAMLTDIHYNVACNAMDIDSINVKRFDTVQDLNNSDLSNSLNDWLIKVL